MECLRDCDWGSVLERSSLEIGLGVGSEAGKVTGSNLESAGISGVPLGEGEASSGFAMRRPPKDCERLKSPSMASPSSKDCG